MWCFIIDSAYVRPRPEKSTCECKGNLLTHPRAFRPFQDRIAIWKCWFLRCGENRSIRRKTSQPTYDAGSVNRTRDTLMGGKRSHYCAIPAPFLCNYLKWCQNSFELIKNWFVILWIDYGPQVVIDLNIDESCEFGVLEVPDKEDFYKP